MAHVGKYYPYADGRDMWLQPWPNRPPPKQLTLGSGITITGTIGGGWTGGKVSSVAIASYSAGTITWKWENVPGTDPRTSVVAEYHVAAAPGGRPYFWRIWVAIDGSPGNVLDALSGFGGGNEFAVSPGGQSQKTISGSSFGILWGQMNSVPW